MMSGMSVFSEPPDIRNLSKPRVRASFRSMSGDVRQGGQPDTPCKSLKLLMSGCPVMSAPKGGIHPWRTSPPLGGMSL